MCLKPNIDTGGDRTRDDKGKIDKESLMRVSYLRRARGIVHVIGLAIVVASEFFLAPNIAHIPLDLVVDRWAPNGETAHTAISCFDMRFR